MTNFQYNVAYTKVSREIQSIARDIFGKEARELTSNEAFEVMKIMKNKA